METLTESAIIAATLAASLAAAFALQKAALTLMLRALDRRTA